MSECEVETDAGEIDAGPASVDFDDDPVEHARSEEAAVGLAAASGHAAATSTMARSPGGKSRRLVIRPTGGWRALDVRELWARRELTLFFVWRDIKVRYKQTVLGGAWAIIQPLLTAGIFTILFGVLMGRNRTPTVPGIPYFVCTFCAMLPWHLFSFALTHSGISLVHNHRMIQKIYFPRLIMPVSAVLPGLADFAVGFVALLVMMVFSGVDFSWRIICAPLFILLALAVSIGAGLWLSALNAIYRDFRYVIPFLIQAGMFASPVVYSASSVRRKLPDWADVLYGLNPMAGAIEGFRWSMFSTAEAPGLMLVPSVLMALALLVSGAFYFRRMERTFADVI